jgi:putative peptidoglycan lipid II flippase
MMLVRKRRERLYCRVLLILLLICALFVQVAQTAWAEPARTTSAVSRIETIRAVSEKVSVPLVILSVPHLTWEMIDEKDPETDTLFAKSALGNLSAPKSSHIASLLENSDVGLYRLSLDATTSVDGAAVGENATSAAAGTAAADIATTSTNVAADIATTPTNVAAKDFSLYAATINEFIKRDLPANAILIIVTAPGFDGGEVSRGFTPIIICGGGLSGYLTSDSTHRTGLISAADIGALQNNLNEPSDSSSHSEATIKSLSTNNSTAARVQHLQHDVTTIDSMLATKASANFAFLMLVFVAFTLSILLLILGRGPQPSSRGSLIPAVRILWLIVLAFPSATFLMYGVLPTHSTPFVLTVAIVVWVAVLSFAALLIGWRTKWVNSLIALFSLSILVIVIGQLFGGPLNSPGYLTYDITEGSRYYGMGNEQGAMLFGSWITLSGLLINRYPGARGIPAFKRWGYPLGSAILLFIATSPWFGASFGPLIWGFLGCFVSWWLFNGWRLRWWIAALVVVCAFGMALGVLYADIALNPISHMYQVVPSMQNGLIEVITRIALDVWSYSFSLIRDYVPAVVIIFLVFVFILLVILRVLQPGSYREFWQRNTAFRAVYSVCFVLAAITFVLEDSGVFTPAVLLIYPIACFVWLICDLHSWHLRALAQSGIPVTLRELQQRALGLLARENEKKRAEADRVENEPSPSDQGVSDLEDTPGAGDAHAHAQDMLGDGDVSDRASYNGHHFRTDVSPPSVGRSTATMSAATLLSRVTGFVRTWAMAFALGNTAFFSAYTIANNLPNMLYELVAGGVLTTAFLPIYLAQLEKRGKNGAASYASNLLSIGAIALGLVVLLATIFAPQVIFTQSFLTFDNPDFDAQNAIFFFRFFAIQVLFYGVGAIISGLLNAHRSFLWPALGPVFNNICVIVTLFGYPFIARANITGAMVWLACGTTLGVVAMFVVQTPALLKLKIPLRFHVNFWDPALKDTLKMALPATGFIIMGLISVSFMNACALNVTPTGPGTILYAWLWYQLPYGVIAVALSTALFTEMSEASAAGDWATFRANVRLGLRSTIFIIIPLAAIIFALSSQLVGLYHIGAGRFTFEDVAEVAPVVAMWCVSLPFYASYMFIYKVFSSLRELSRFIVIDAIGRVLLVTLYGFFTTGFGLFEGFGLVGIPLADTCVNALLCAVMLFVLRKRIGTFGVTRIVLDGGRLLAAALLAAALPFLLVFGKPDPNVLVSILTVILCGLFSLGVYYLLCRLLKIPEIALVNSIVSRLTSRVSNILGGGRR